MARIQIYLPEKFIFKTEERIRITDINYGNHLGNDSILSIIHESRVRMLNHFGFSEVDVCGVGIIMTDAAIIYKSEGLYGMVLQIEIAISDFSRVGCDIYHRITDKDTSKEIAIAKTGIVFFDYTRKKVVSVPDKFKKLFS